jgi:hypothetical protein
VLWSSSPRNCAQRGCKSSWILCAECSPFNLPLAMPRFFSWILNIGREQKIIQYRILISKSIQTGEGQALTKAREKENAKVQKTCRS